MIHIWPLAHFFFGFSVTLPFVLLLLWIAKKKEKVKNLKEFLKKRAIFGVLGGIWAMIPDIDHFLEEPVLSTQSFSDIFFFHVSFDRILPETDLFFAAEMLLVFTVVILFSLAATVESFHRLKQALFGRKEEDDEEDEEDKELEGEEDKEEDKDYGEEEDIGEGKEEGEKEDKEVDVKKDNVEGEEEGTEDEDDKDEDEGERDNKNVIVEDEDKEKGQIEDELKGKSDNKN